MSIIRVVKDSRVRYLLTDAEPHLRTDLSWEARGLHAFLMLMPDKWEVRMGHLLEAGPAKKDKLQRMINELKAAGYLNRVQIHDLKTGKFRTVTDVYERVELNCGMTPTYGGDNSTVTGFPATDRDGFTVTGKPGDIANTDLSIYKGSLKDFETPGPFLARMPDEQDIHDMTIALATVCQGFANLLVPDNCPFRNAAVSLLQAGRTTDEVLAFRKWWEENGTYDGQPALKSLMDNLNNAINGLQPGKKRGKSPDVIKAIQELDLWIGRKIKPAEFASPHTLPAIRGVGESMFRGMTSNNRQTILGKFETEFERAKQNAGT